MLKRILHTEAKNKTAKKDNTITENDSTKITLNDKIYLFTLLYTSSTF